MKQLLTDQLWVCNRLQQSASPENIAVNVGLATQLSELKQLMLSSHDEARLLKEQMSEINRRLTVLEAVTKSQETR